MELISTLLQEVADARGRVQRAAWKYQANQMLDSVEYWLRQAQETGALVDPAQFREAIAEAERTATEGPEPRRVLGRVSVEALSSA